MGVIRTFLVGGAIGAGLAMLLTPRTGQETQSQLRERVKGLRDQYGDVIEQGRIRATELVQSGRDMIDQGQTMVNSAVDRTRSTQGESESTERTDTGTQASETPHQQL